MVDVIVSFRDAVFAALMTWGGVAGEVETAGVKPGEDLPQATPKPVEKTVETPSRRFC